MPIYLYRCENCGFQFEQQQKFSDDPLIMCPECGQETLRKVYVPVGIVFKGSGFYSTDNRSTKGLAQSKPKEDSNGTSGEKKTDDSSSNKESVGKKEKKKNE